LLIQGRWDELWYPVQWRLRGYDFGSAGLEVLRLDPSRSNAHGNSGGPELERVLRAVGVENGSRIVDFGSGKGGAVLTMCKFPFAEVVGVELSRALISIAEGNCRRARARQVRFVETDAAEFADLDPFTHVYMYHPFPCAVVERVCANLQASLTRRNRKLTLIYKNPVCEETVLESGVFRRGRDMRMGAGDPESERYRIYVHDAAKMQGESEG